MRRVVVVGAVLLIAVCSCAARFPVDGERALERVKHQVAAGARIPGTAAHDSVRAWIASELERLGGSVEQQSFLDSSLGRTLPVTNVIGRFGPAGARRVVLCAHYDSRPVCDQDPDPAHRADPMPGANDAGSGVAVLLEVAEVMHRQPPPVGVDLVFFDAEDLGRSDHPEEFSIGAKGYAARLPAPGDPQRPVAGFLFDMVGDKDLAIHPEQNSREHASNLVDMVLDGARATGATGFRTAPRYTLTDDHLPLIAAGLPTADIIDFDYPVWHTHLDLPDQVSAASLAEVARVAAWLVYRSPLTRH